MREKDSSHAIFSLTNLMLDFETSAAASLMMIESRNSMKFHESSSNLAVMSLQASSQIPFVFLHVEILKEKVTMPRYTKIMKKCVKITGQSKKRRTYVHAQVWHECASLFGLSRFSALHTLDVSSAAKIAFEFCSLHYTFSLQSLVA